MLKAYKKFLDLIEKLEKILLTISLSIMTIIIVYQVILRYVFNRSNSWSEELARYLMVFSVMVGAAIAIRRNSHLQIDVFINLLKPRMKGIITIISTLVGIAFLAYLFIYSLQLCVIGSSNVSAGLGISMMLPYIFIPLGVVLMFLTSIEVILKKLDDLKLLKTTGGSR